jgi:autotransporter-associated beta strand protein
MKSFVNFLRFFFLLSLITLTGFNVPTTSEESKAGEKEFIVEIPNVSYPLPIVDYIGNNDDAIKKRSINDNPVAYILRGINDIWKGTTNIYQSASSANGPGKNDYENGSPIIDSLIWRENIQYVINVTNNRTDEEAILAYLDDVRAKYYSVIDGFGPLTEDYIKNSGAYVDLPQVTCKQVLENAHYQSLNNDNAMFAGNESSTLGAVVRLAHNFRNMHASTDGAKYLYSTPRPWRMNDDGAVNFLGTTYDSITQKPTYSCITYAGVETFKIFDIYESSVKVVPGLICSRSYHTTIYNDDNPSSQDLYSNTTESRRKDNAYPSGHANAGFLCALAYAYAFPERFSELVYRGSQLGENRIVSGMHSPVDVIGGNIMALAIACAALNQPDIASNAEKAVSKTYEFFGAKADKQKVSLYEYAHSKVDSPAGYIKGELVNIKVFNNNFYDDREKIKKIYRSRLTYGFSQDPAKVGQESIVPKGAEVILKSRFPYLTDNQRRVVLYTTEIPSGNKIVDKTNGWGRIDLLSAADGYGSFIGNVSINMDASLGRFNALDTWGNDIDGDGCLIKQGTGKLILTGNNSFSGGTKIVNGLLATASISALGCGNVTIENGTLEIINPLLIKEELKLTGGIMLVHVNSNNTTQIIVDDTIKIGNSTLLINFDEELEVKSGDRFAIIQADDILGSFTNISAINYNI